MKFKPRALRICSNVLFVLFSIAYFPGINFISNTIENNQDIEYRYHRESANNVNKLIFDRIEARYLCDPVLITKLGGVIDTGSKEALYGPYKLGMKPLDVYRLEKKLTYDDYKRDPKLRQSSWFNYDDTKDFTYRLNGIIYTHSRGEKIADERIPAPLDSVCQILSDSLSALFGQPYYSFASDSVHVKAWTNKGIVHALLVKDVYADKYYNMHKHQYEAEIATYNPAQMMDNYERVFSKYKYGVVVDSIASLFFKGIKLGGSFKNQVLPAVSKGVFKRGEWNRDHKHIYLAETSLVAGEEEIFADVAFLVNGDQIYGITLSSKSEKLHKIYEEKYGYNHSFLNQHIEFYSKKIETRGGYGPDETYYYVQYVQDSLMNVVKKNRINEERAKSREQAEKERLEELRKKERIEQKRKEQEI